MSESDPDRAALLRLASLLPERPAFGVYRLRPFSLWTLDLCEQIGLDIFLKLPEGQARAGGRLFQMAALIWFHDLARPEDEIDLALMLGTWREPVKSLSRAPEMADAVPALSDYLALFSRLIAAATVKVKPRPKRKGDTEEKTPASVIEPGGTFALIWAIAGGQIAGRDQERFLYRGLSLPKLLSYYHCALRASLAWTIPAGKGGKKVDPDKLRAAAEARAKLAAATVSTADSSAPLDFVF